MDLKEEAALGSAIDKHWYYLSKARMAAYHVPDKMFRILDVGAGAGWFSRWFLRHGFSSEATCVDPGILRIERSLSRAALCIFGGSSNALMLK